MSRIPSISIATIDDLPTIVEIYNQAIKSKNATGDMDEFTVKERVEWFDKFDDNNYPIYVAKIEDDITGYATLSPYREGRKAMNRIAEISFYLDYSYHGLGIGSALVDYIISDCKRIHKDTLLAILLDINVGSIGLLKKFNFKQWGHLPNIVNFDDVKCGQFIYGLNLEYSSV